MSNIPLYCKQTSLQYWHRHFLHKPKQNNFKTKTFISTQMVINPTVTTGHNI